MPTATPNWDSIAANITNLGTTLYQRLTETALAGLTDPETQDMIARATATIATGVVSVIGADEATQADAKNAYDAATATLLTLASAQFEDDIAAAESAQAQVRQVVSEVVSDAIKVGIAALVAV
jgi:hypothetical protein